MSVIEIKNLTVSTKERTVGEGFSFAISSGEIHILMGPNGSGKSSLVNAIFGHPKYSISGGTIFLDGEDITNLSTEKKAKRGLFLSLQHLPQIAGVSLNRFLYRSCKEIKNETASIVEFHKKMSEKSLGLGINQEFLDREVNTGMSGGGKKQSEGLQLAELETKFAFLDEIDSGVDVDSLDRVFKAIKQLAADGTGFLLITHYPGILKKIAPDFVHIMKDGKIVKSGGQEIIKKIESKGFI